MLKVCSNINTQFEPSLTNFSELNSKWQHNHHCETRLLPCKMGSILLTYLCNARVMLLAFDCSSSHACSCWRTENSLGSVESECQKPQQRWKSLMSFYFHYNEIRFLKVMCVTNSLLVSHSSPCNIKRYTHYVQWNTSSWYNQIKIENK